MQPVRPFATVRKVVPLCQWWGLGLKPTLFLHCCLVSASLSLPVVRSNKSAVRVSSLPWFTSSSLDELSFHLIVSRALITDRQQLIAAGVSGHCNVAPLSFLLPRVVCLHVALCHWSVLTYFLKSVLSALPWLIILCQLKLVLTLYCHFASLYLVLLQI